MGDPNKAMLPLREFVDVNRGTTSEGIVWDTLKAFLRGLLMQQITKIKKNRLGEGNNSGRTGH